MKLLVIADDFTGALDTGIQFRARQAQVRVMKADDPIDLARWAEGLQVLILVAETRHMKSRDAYDVIARITREAVALGVECIYKKTDSGLRGNIGAELSAMLQASGGRHLHFIPAFPRMGRTTEGGVHYINGVPVASSIFGSDPFEPVLHSSVPEILARQSSVTAISVGASVPRELPDGILVYDGKSDEDLADLARELSARDELHLLAGCAGFAATLPRVLNLEQNSEELPPFRPRLLTVCGSINPITIGQLQEGIRSGVPCIRLSPAEELTPGWADSPEGQASMARWLEQISASPHTILACSGVFGTGDSRRFAEGLDLDLDGMRERISDTMGSILKHLLDRGLESTLLVTGGDTLLAFLRHIRQESLVPIRELLPGVVLSQFQYRGKTFNLITKSGGFGEKSLLADLEIIISGRDPHAE